MAMEGAGAAVSHAAPRSGAGGEDRAGGPQQPPATEKSAVALRSKPDDRARLGEVNALDAGKTRRGPAQHRDVGRACPLHVELQIGNVEGAP